MNNQLISIDDDALDLVSGGEGIVIDPGATIDAGVDFFSDLVKGLTAFFPVIEIPELIKIRGRQ
ncbi:MAG TPA: hypothetical protein VFX59_13055 [Polyangiales bacterium]|nr:hypothetical protein [Polyangiales bacterium]